MSAGDRSTLDSSELARILDRARSTKTLSLREHKLGSVPDEVFEIDSLKELDLSYCDLRPLPPDRFSRLRELRHLSLAGNNLGSLPDGLGELNNLRSLDVSGNDLVELPSSLGRLSALAVVIAQNNELSELPEVLCHIRSLQTLDLSLNELGHLPADLSNLAALQYLYCFGNRFTEFPHLERPMPQLLVLDLSDCGSRSKAGSEEFFGLRAQYMIHSSKSLGQMPSSRATAVIRQSPRGSSLGSLPDRLGSYFPNLRVLDLGGHRVANVGSAVADLHSLEGLYLESCGLDRVPRELGELRALVELDLNSNRLKVFPIETLRSLRRLGSLDVTKNSINLPPEILESLSAPRIIDYAISLTRDETRPLNQAKVLIVGEGSVGKTSIVRRLTKDSFDPDEDKTPGINIQDWGVGAGEQRIDLAIWDFGGQEIMHATHQFFLTKRSLYILVIDSRQSEEQNRIQYWLKLIHGFSAGSPVILVGNKKDQAPLDIDQRGILSKYRNVLAVLETSCFSGEGIRELELKIQEIVKTLPHVGDQLPVSYFRVKSRLENLTDSLIPYADYAQICREEGIRVESRQETLMGFLHDLGTVLCFRDHPVLSETNILNPNWVTGGVYRILNSHLASQNRGLLSAVEVDSILGVEGYTAHQCLLIIEMMKKFELAFQDDGNRILVPDLLGKEEPFTGDWETRLRFRFQYDILPSSILSRLIVRMHSLISKGTMWRTGLVLEFDDNRALVTADMEENQVTILVTGNPAGRRGLLTLIRSQIRMIQTSIPGLQSAEQVPVPGYPGVYVDYEHLLLLERNGEVSLIPVGTATRVSVSSLLNGVEERSERAKVHDRQRIVEGDFIGSKEGQRRPSRFTGAERLAFVLVIVYLSVVAGLTVTVLVTGVAAAGVAAAAMAVLLVSATVLLRVRGDIDSGAFERLITQIIRASRRETMTAADSTEQE